MNENLLQHKIDNIEISAKQNVVPGRKMGV